MTAVGGAVLTVVLLAAAGCGLDAVGLDLPEEAAAVVDLADASRVDAPSDASDDPVVLDVHVVVEAAPPPGLCDDPALVLCVRFVPGCSTRI